MLTEISFQWHGSRINHYATLLGIQKDMKYYDTKTGDIHPKHLVTCMALREAGERHHDNAGWVPEVICCCGGAYDAGEGEALRKGGGGLRAGA